MVITAGSRQSTAPGMVAESLHPESLHPDQKSTSRERCVPGLGFGNLKGHS